MATGELVVDLYRHRSEQRQFHCKIIHAGPPVPLSEIMPRLENMGLKVLNEVPYEVQPLGAPHPVRIRDFSLSADGMQDDLGPVKEKFQEAFIRVWNRQAENDGFNRLVLTAELEWHEVVVLRAYCKYLRQVGSAFSQAYMERTLAANPHIARLLVELFHARFDPARQPDPADEASVLTKRLEAAIDAVASLDEDRILRSFLALVQATQRTNWFRAREPGHPVAFKFDPAQVPDLPLPRPRYEIFVCSPRVEGVHLRGGRVSRGGRARCERLHPVGAGPDEQALTAPPGQPLQQAFDAALFPGNDIDQRITGTDKRLQLAFFAGDGSRSSGTIARVYGRQTHQATPSL